MVQFVGSKKATYLARFDSLQELRQVAKAAAKLRISMNKLVTESAREVARMILADGKEEVSPVIETRNRLTLNQ